MIDERRSIADIPVRLLTKTTALRGTVLFYHGFMSSIAEQSNELRSLADNGYLAVEGDAIGHGQRRYLDFEERFSSDNAKHEDNYCANLFKNDPRL